MSETAVIRLTFTAAGILIMGLSIPTIRRRIAPNVLYGMRMPATFADEWVCYEANARSGRDLFIIGVGMCILAFALPLVPGARIAPIPRFW